MTYSHTVDPHRSVLGRLQRQNRVQSLSDRFRGSSFIHHTGLTHRHDRCERIVSQESGAFASLAPTGKCKEYVIQTHNWVPIFHSWSCRVSYLWVVHRNRTVDKPDEGTRKVEMYVCGMKDYINCNGDVSDLQPCILSFWNNIGFLK